MRQPLNGVAWLSMRFMISNCRRRLPCVGEFDAFQNHIDGGPILIDSDGAKRELSSAREAIMAVQKNRPGLRRSDAGPDG